MSLELARVLVFELSSESTVLMSLIVIANDQEPLTALQT